MESRRKRSRSQMLKWGCYILLLVVCTVVQTTPGLFQFGAAKPLWLLPLCLAVSAAEGEFAGAIFGAVCGLMWDYTAGRTVGMLALELMILCFGVSVVVQLYLKDTPSNFVLLAVTGIFGLLNYFVGKQRDVGLKDRRILWGLLVYAVMIFINRLIHGDQYGVMRGLFS